jgi:hypothetical protein
MKKLLMMAGLGALAYWLVKDRLGGEPDEFAFTEAPETDLRPATDPPGSA